MPQRGVKIANYKAIGKNTLVGSFDLLLASGIVICGAMVHVKGDSTWIAFPGRPYTVNGAVSYAKLIDIPDRDTRDKFNSLVLDALRSAGHI
jgi:hypothetical protein